MSPRLFDEWRSERRLKRGLAAYIAALMAEPDADDVAWMAHSVCGGDEDRAAWELRYARRALGLVAERVAPDGKLFIAIYNDQGGTSRRWRTVKRLYNRLPRLLQTPYAVAVAAPREARSLAIHLVRRHPEVYLRNWTQYDVERGMSKWNDIVDWIGGFPFEVAGPAAIFAFYRERGFELQFLYTCAGGPGCNEFVFWRPPTP